MHTLRTSDTVAAPAEMPRNGSARRLSFLRVIAAASPFWRIAAGLVAIVALVSTAHDRVPFASGLTVAVLALAAIVDVYERRLPDIIVGAAGITFAFCMGIDSAIPQTGVPLAGIAAGITAFAGPLLVLHMVAPASMGFGDVKAGIVLGAAIGIVDWQLALAGLAVAAGFTATVGVLIRASTMAFGPGLVAASALMLAVHPVVLSDPDHTGARHAAALQVASAKQHPSANQHPSAKQHQKVEQP